MVYRLPITEEDDYLLSHLRKYSAGYVDVTDLISFSC